MNPTALKGYHKNIEQCIINCVRITNITKCMNCALTTYYGSLPAECHGLQGEALIECTITYVVDRPKEVKVQCA